MFGNKRHNVHRCPFKNLFAKLLWKVFLSNWKALKELDASLFHSSHETDGESNKKWPQHTASLNSSACIFQNTFSVSFAVEMHICKLNFHGHATLTSNLLEQHIICVYFNSGNRQGFCYAEKGASSFSVVSRAECQLPCSVLGLLLSKSSSQAIPGSLSDSAEKSLNAEIHGELCFPGTACLFQLVSDWR